MLVLTRKPGEALSLGWAGPAWGGRPGEAIGANPGAEIIVSVLAVEGDRVKLGITAPRWVAVLRRELCETVRQENRAAAVPAHAAGQIASAARGLIRAK